MPTVPTYDNLQVAPTSQPRAEFSAPPQGAFNSVAAQATAPLDSVSQSLQNISQLMIQQQQRRDVEKVTKAEAELVAMDTDFRRNAAQRLGENAHGLTTEADKWWGETTRKMSESFENDMQRQAFDAIVQRRRTMSIDHVAGHEAQQSRVAAGQAAEASVNAHISAAAAAISSGMTPAAQETIADSRNRALKAYQAMALTNGLPAEARQAGEMQITTKMHTEVIQGLVEKDPDQAKAWFYANKKEIDGSRHAEIEKILEVGGLESKRQQVADELVGKRLGYAEGLQYIRENFSGKEESAIVQEWKLRIAEDREAKEQAEISALAPIQTLLGDAINAGRAVGRNERQSVLAKLKVDYPELYLKGMQMIDQHNDEIRSESEHAMDRARANAERYGSSAADGQVANWYQLKTNPGALRVTNLLVMQTKGLISKKHFDDLVGDQQGLIKSHNPKEAENNLLSDKSAVDLVLKGSGIETGERGDPALLGKFYERFNARAKAAGDGKPISQQQKVDIARDLLKEVAVERSWWFDKKTRAFELDPAERGSVVVPKLDRDAIVSELRRQRRPVTESLIREVYVRGLE